MIKHKNWRRYRFQKNLCEIKLRTTKNLLHRTRILSMKNPVEQFLFVFSYLLESDYNLPLCLLPILFMLNSYNFLTMIFLQGLNNLLEYYILFDDIFLSIFFLPCLEEQN